MISYPVPRGELLQWRRNPEMELTCVCTHTHLPMIVQTCSYIWCHPPKCSHMHTTQHTHTHTQTLSLSFQAHEQAQKICTQIICMEAMETRPLPSPPSLTQMGRAQASLTPPGSQWSLNPLSSSLLCPPNLLPQPLPGHWLCPVAAADST